MVKRLINNDKLDNIDFINILPSFRWQRHYIFLLAADKIYVIRINTPSLTLELLHEIDPIKLGIDTNKIKSAVVYQEDTLYFRMLNDADNRLIILTQMGDDSWEKTLYNNFEDENGTVKDLNILDILFELSRAFILVKDYGLITFSLKYQKFNQEYYKHPYMVKLDYFYDEYANNLLGIYFSSEVNEFLMELIETNKTMGYMINKIFVSKISINHGNTITSDKKTFIHDFMNNKLIILTRGAYYYHNRIEYAINGQFKNIFNSNVLVYQDNYSYTYFLNDDQCIELSNFKIHRNQLIFSTENEGTYELTNTDSSNSYIYDYKIIIKVGNPYETKSNWFFIIMIIIAIIVFLIIAIFVIVYLKKAISNRRRLNELISPFNE